MPRTTPQPDKQPSFAVGTELADDGVALLTVALDAPGRYISTTVDLGTDPDAVDVEHATSLLADAVILISQGVDPIATRKE